MAVCRDMGLASGITNRDDDRGNHLRKMSLHVVNAVQRRIDNT
jgi:hypothetical protein